MTNGLTAYGSRTLEQCEEAIVHNLDCARSAYREIKERKLYKETHSRWEDYCEQRWRMSVDKVDRLIATEQVQEALGEIPHMCGKIPVRAIPDLIDLPPEQQRQVVAKATENGKKPTAKAVKEARQEVAPKEDAPEADIVCDDLGRPVPKRFRIAHANGQRIDSIARKLDGILRDLKTVAAEDGGDVLRGHLSAIERWLKDAKREAMSCSYWTCCPACDGKGCKRCDDLGWLPERKSGGLTAKEKETLGVE